MVLRNVAKTFSLEEQRQEINEIAVDLDAVNTTLTNWNASQWDTAYGWGDHALAGYLVATTTDKTNWNTAFGWGDHASAGYLTAYQTDAQIKTSYEANADTNAFTDAFQTKLNGIEAGATADQTAAEIRTLVGSASDSNVFTDAEKTKLSGIETGATADQTGAEIKTAYEGEADTNAFTDAEQTKLSGIEAGATVNAATGGTSGGLGTQADPQYGSVQFRGGTNTLLGDSVFVYDTTNNRLGINNGSPDQSLHVSGNLEVNAYDSAGGTGGYTTGSGLIIGNAYDAGITTLTDDRNAIIWQERALDLDIGTQDAFRVKLTYDGNIGIGTQTPTKGSFFGGDQQVVHISGSAAPELRIQSSTSGQGDMSIIAGNSAKNVHFYNRGSNASTRFDVTDSDSNLIQGAFEILGRGLARGSSTKGLAPANGSTLYSASTNGDFRLGLDLFDLPGNAWWNASVFFIYSGVDGGLSGESYKVGLVQLRGLGAWGTNGVSNIVGTTTVTGANGTSDHIDLDFDVGDGNRGTFACWVLSPNGQTPIITFAG